LETFPYVDPKILGFTALFYLVGFIGHAFHDGPEKDLSTGCVAGGKDYDQLLATFIEKDDALGDILSGLSPEDQAKPCYHPGSIVPAGNFVDLRFKEIVLHEWDIRSGIEDQVTLSPNSLESIVTLICESFASGSVRWAFWAGKPLEKPVRYRFEVKEPVLITAGILVRGDAFRLELSALGPADVTFRCDTNTFALMMYGRMPVQAAVESGQLEVEGDAQLAARFGQWFKGI